MPNPYDNEVFFQKYSQMDRSMKGLAAAGEWETLKTFLPDFRGKRVLDMGCGFGWHCQYAVENGASAVLGVDVSENMLAVAKEKTDPSIVYKREAIEKLNFPEGSFDLVLSSLVLHYVESFADVARKAHNWLADGGDFVFSVEHPVFTAYGNQDWIYDENGEILHFPVDHYFEEGARQANFLGEEITKQHKTLTTYIGELLQAGFNITGFAEPQPAAHLLDVPGMKDELRRPMMLIIAARKRGNCR